jgi:hypothetical protein
VSVARVRVGATIGVIALLAAGCSSSLPPGEQAAQNTRIATGQQYWKTFKVIYPQLFHQMSGGVGNFVACPPAGGGPATQIAYTIYDFVMQLNGRVDPGQFVADLEQSLQAHGWSPFTTQNGLRVSTSGGYRVTLQPKPDKADFLDKMTFTGPCVAVGAKFAAEAPTLKLDDGYADGDVNATPTPRKTLP